MLGVAVLASVFAANGGYESPQAFADGVGSALPVAAVVLAAGAVLALVTPRRATLRDTANGGEALNPARATA